jgi:YfiH family protein
MGVPALASPLLERVAGVRHAFFTRDGGVSEGLYASLNAGLGSGDDAARVAENRRRALARLAGDGPAALVTVYQTHSPDAVVADAPWAGAPPRADAIVTRRQGLALGALAADCAPVLIVDADAGVAAAAHAGWRGALAGVIEATVQAMAALGAAPRRMVAAVGPCIGPASYEVGLEFLEAFTAADAENRRFFAPGARAEKRLFDLPGFVLARLQRAGVGEAEWIGRNTCDEADRFFSNRRALLRGEPDYGRLLSAIMLTE